MRGVHLEPVQSEHEEAFLAAVARSRSLHRSWVAPPNSPELFRAYLLKTLSEDNVGYIARNRSGEFLGVVNLSAIVRGAFQSAYLGYYAFAPFAGRGYMKAALGWGISSAFSNHGLHRVEANIQPGNAVSRALAQALGFELEGFSPRYLKIGGRWRDHERWALRKENWKPRALRAG